MKIIDIVPRKKTFPEQISQKKTLSLKKRLFNNRYLILSNLSLFSRFGLAVFLILSFLGSSISFVSAPVQISFADTLEERKNLEQKLSEIESEIQAYEKNIEEVQGEKKTLANEIKILDKTMAKINLQIKAIDLEIQRLNLRINDLGVNIKDSETKIDAQRELLGDSLKVFYENGQLSLLE